MAPAADKTIAGLDEVDRTLELRPPNAFSDPIFGLIYLHKTTWRKNRVHREVFCSDVAVGVPDIGQRGKIRKRHYTPLFDHAGDVRAFGHREPWDQTDRDADLRYPASDLRQLSVVGP